MNKNVPKLRFKGFNDEWSDYKIKELCKLSSGSTPSKLKKEYFTGDIPWVTSGELKNKCLYKTIDNITEMGREDARLKIYDIGTFLIAIYGLEAEGVRGKSTILGKQATISQACMALEPNSKMLSEYLYYWYEKYGNLIGLKYAQGTKQQNLSTNLVGDLNIHIPSLEEQEKIANFLSNVDKIIEEQEGKVKDLEVYKKGMMQKIFKQEIRFKDENGKEYPDWDRKTLKYVLREFSEKSKISNQYEVLSSTAVGVFKQSEYFNREIASADNTGYKVLKLHQIVLSPQNLWLGNINYNDRFDIGIVSPSYKIFDINNSLNKKFISYIIKNNRMLYEYKQASEQGASVVRRNLNLDLFYDIIVKLPCLKEQIKIANLLSNIDNIIEEENKKLEDLKEWKKGLLQQMFV